MEEDWDSDLGFTDDDSNSIFAKQNDSPANKSGQLILGICAERFVETEENKWDDDFAFDKSEGSGGMFIPNFGSKLKQEEKKGDSTTGDITEFGDSEDWDAELGIDIEPSALQVLPSLVDVPSAVKKEQKQESGLLSSRYRWRSEKLDLVIVKFPRIPLLYSLKEKEGFRLCFTEEDFCKWITSLMTEPLLGTKVQTSFSQVKEQFYRGKLDHQPFSVGWINSHANYCSDMYRQGEYEVVHEALGQFFAEIKQSTIPTDLFPLVDFFLTYMVLLACKLWKEDEDELFVSDILDVVKKLRPSLTDRMDLLQAECYSHHNESKQYLDKDPLALFVDLYCRQREQDSETALQIRAQILIDVHLYANCCSPLTSSKVDVDPDLRTDEINCMRREKGRLAEDLLTSDIRISTLTDLYHQLPLSFLKAKAAFVLAMADETELRNHHAAERKYLESLYILHVAPSFLPNFFLLVTELGSNVLYKFAKKLEYQSKYRYAILVYHACGQALQLRGCVAEYFTLLRKMAASSKENDDYQRSLAYYKELLQHYIEGEKTNEIIHVSEILSKTYADAGRFDIAEEYLLGAYSKLPQRQRLTSNPTTFQLQFNLAKLYLSGFFYERGILLLEHLLHSPHPRGKKASLVSTLARAYVTKRNYRAFRELMAQAASGDSKFSHLRHKRNQSLGKHGTSSGGSAPQSLSKKSNPLHDIAARNYLHAKRFKEAIHSIDLAIALCAHSNFSALGKYFYIRGKIFAAICSPNEAIIYPAQLIKKPSPDASPPFTSEFDVLQESLSCFRKAYRYFGAVGDDIRETKCLSRIAEVFLNVLFTPVMLQHRSFESVANHPYFKSSDILDKPGVEHVPLRNGDRFEISITMIEVPAERGLDSASEFGIPFQMLRGLMNMAEVYLLLGKEKKAFAFWEECSTNLLYGWILPFVGKYTRPSLLERIYKMLHRVIRVLFCYEQCVINKNLIFLDVNNLVELSIEHSKRIPVPLPGDGGSTNSILSLISIHNARMCKTSLTNPIRCAKDKEMLRKQNKVRKRNFSSSSRMTTTVRNFFGKSSFDWENIAPPLDLENDLAVQAHGALYYTNSLLSRYMSRKQSIGKEEVGTRNHKQLRFLHKCGIRAGISSLLSPLVPEGENKVPFDAILTRCPTAKRLLYILHLDGCAAVYSPILPHSLKLQNLKNLSEQRSDNVSADLQNSATESLTKKLEERGKFTVEVGLLSNDAEYASFEVKNATSFNELLHFICEMSQWGAQKEQEDQKKGYRRPSLKSSKILRIPIKPLMVSSGFNDEIGRLVSLSLENSIFFLPAPRLLFASQKRISESQLSLIPIGGSMNEPIQTLQATGSGNVRLCLYTSSFAPRVEELDTMSQLPIGETFEVSRETLLQLKRFVTSKNEKNADDHKRAIVQLIQQCKPLVIDSIPPPTDGKQACQSLLPAAADSSAITNFPLLLVCSPTLQIFPWELILDDTVIRSVSLCNIIFREKYQNFVGKNSVAPTFITFSYSSFDRTTQTMEEERKVNAFENSIEKLGLSSKLKKGTNEQTLSTVLPLQLLTKKRKTHFLCLDEEKLSKDASYIVEFLSAQSENVFNIVILSYANLVEHNETTSYLLSCACNSIMLFIPQSHIKLASLRMQKLLDNRKQNRKTLHQFILSQARALQREFHLPIVVMNSP